MVTVLSARDIEDILPRPSAAIERLGDTVMRVVSAQWERYVGEVFKESSEARRAVYTPKARFSAIMYARGCYSMVILGRYAPLPLRTLVRLSAHLPLTLDFSARAGSLIFSALPFLLPKRLQRRIVLVGVLMAVFDDIVDEYALQKRETHEVFESNTMRTLVSALREGESRWQRQYWDTVLMPAKMRFAREEQQAVAGEADPEAMGHRGAGIDSGVKTMWYAVGPYIGLRGCADVLNSAGWNRLQRWMADGAMLVQMMDDWVDRDRDALTRPTPVTQGQWTMCDIEAQYRKTCGDLVAALRSQGICSQTMQNVVCALYAEYLQRAARAMHDARD